jgi:hypothetical protein
MGIKLGVNVRSASIVPRRYSILMSPDPEVPQVLTVSSKQSYLITPMKSLPSQSVRFMVLPRLDSCTSRGKDLSDIGMEIKRDYQSLLGRKIY